MRARCPLAVLSGPKRPTLDNVGSLRSALVIALSVGSISGCSEDNPAKPSLPREHPLTFAMPVPVMANGVTGGSQLLVADLNVDGRADIVATRDSSKVWVAFASGSGSFGNSASYAAGVTPNAIATGDLNGDNRGDIVVAGAGAVTALWGQAQGFSSPETLVVIENGGVARQVVCGGFDPDGYSDLCFIFEWWQPGSPNSTFSLGMATSGGAYHQYDNVWNMPLAVGDVTGDGALDVVGTTWGATQAWAYLYIGNGDGSLQPAVTKPTTPAPTRAVVTDLDGVGDGDLAMGHTLNKGTVGVLSWKNSELRAESTYTAGIAITSVASADFNADGKQDVVAASSGTSNVGVLLGNGDGSLRTPTNFNVGGSPRQIAVGDVDGDGLIDIVVSGSSGLTLLRNTSIP